MESTYRTNVVMTDEHINDGREHSRFPAPALVKGYGLTTPLLWCSTGTRAKITLSLPQHNRALAQTRTEKHVTSGGAVYVGIY